MKILHQNFKKGVVKLKVESLDDLWYLYHLIQAGDRITAKSMRRIKAKSDRLRSGEDERKPVLLTVEVEKKGWEEGNKVKVHGPITSSSEELVPLGSYHSFNFTPGQQLSIYKNKWGMVEQRLLHEASQNAYRPKVIVVIVERGEAIVAKVLHTRIESVEVHSHISGKYYKTSLDEQRVAFYRKIMEVVESMWNEEKSSAIIIAGVGFEKEHFFEYFKQKYPSLTKYSILESTGSHGYRGVKEVLKKSSVRKLVSKLNSANEMKLMDELLTHIGKETGLGIYSLPKVKMAIEYKAVKTLMATSNFFAKNRDVLEALLIKLRAQKGNFHIINSESEAGKQLDGIGGIGALLHFRVE